MTLLISNGVQLWRAITNEQKEISGLLCFVIALVKPQFEAGKENVGKKGVVRDPKVHADVIKKVVAFAKEEGFGIAGLDFSPIKGPEGNIEYLLHLTLGDDNAVSETMIDELVSKSHGDLDTPQTQE